MNVLLLQVEAGPLSGQQFTLSERGGSIGRGQRCTINVPADAYPKISREHARISWNGSNFLLQDMGSTNGTYLNGQRMSEVSTLVPGAHIKMGDLLFTCTMQSVVDAPLAKPDTSPTSPTYYAVIGIVVVIALAIALFTLTHHSATNTSVTPTAPLPQPPLTPSHAVVDPNANTTGMITAADEHALDECQYATILISCGRMRGTAFFISPDGLALTNCHVLADENTAPIQGVLQSEAPQNARLITQTPPIQAGGNDLAVLQFNYHPKHFLAFGNSDHMKAGETKVMAIGYPEGDITQAVTHGYINRQMQNGDFWEMDAKINHGNSGGPVINEKTMDVVGVATLRNPGSQGDAQGMNILISSRTVHAFLQKANLDSSVEFHDF